MGHDWFLLIWALVCIVVVLAMSYWVTRVVAGSGFGGFRKGTNGRTGGQIEVITQELLGKDQRLMIVRVGEKYYLIGVTSNAISMLSEIPWDETMTVSQPAEAGHTPPSFGEAFTSVLKQKLRR